MSQPTPPQDETLRCAAIFLGGRLATAPGLAQMFGRLFPGQSDVVADYLASVEQMQRVYDETMARTEVVA